MTTVGINEFVRRQTPESRYAHYAGTLEELAKTVEWHYNTTGKIKPGYRTGVVLIDVPPSGFFTSIVPMETVERFEVKFEARQEGEKPVRVTYAYGPKSPAKHVEIVHVDDHHVRRLSGGHAQGSHGNCR